MTKNIENLLFRVWMTGRDCGDFVSFNEWIRDHNDYIEEMLNNN